VKEKKSKWKSKLFTGGELLEEVRPNYDIRNYHLFCAFIAVHSMLIFVAFLQRNLASVIFMVIFLLIIIQMGGLVSR
jgi:hypothetical protein